MYQICSFGLSSIPHRFRSASHSVPYRYRWRSMIEHTDGSALNNDSERPGCGTRTLAARSSSSSSQPVAVGCAAGRPGSHSSCIMTFEVAITRMAAHTSKRLGWKLS